MIFQIYQTFQQYNKTGLDNMLVYVATITPAFVPMLLVTIFITIAGGIYFGTRRIGEGGDIWSASAVAGLVTFVITLIMTLKDGLVNLTIIGISALVSMVSVIALYIHKKREF